MVKPNAPRIMISYRRQDSDAITGRIFDHLKLYYGSELIFCDIDNIPIGADFREHVQGVLDRSAAVIAIIGPRWFGPNDSENRLFNEADPVRMEIETALRNGTPLIPVLVLGATMPEADQLPEIMRDFSFRNALRIDAGIDFEFHTSRLLRVVDGIIGLEVNVISKMTRRANLIWRLNYILAVVIVLMLGSLWLYKHHYFDRLG